MYMMTPNYESQKKNKQAGAMRMSLSYTSPNQAGAQQGSTKRTQSNKKAAKAARGRGGKSSAKPSRSKPVMKLLLSLLLVAVLMLTAWIQEKSSAGNQTADAAMQDFTMLAGWGDKLLLNGALANDWAFRWDLTLMYGGMEQLADQVFRTERGSLLSKNIRGNGSIIDGEAELPASYIKFARTEQDKIAEKVTVMLQIDGSQLEKLSAMQGYVANLQQMFREADQNVQMSMKVFGKAKDKDAINSLKQMAVAQIVDKYSDRGTNSTTFFSSQIKQYRWLQNEKMANIQAALHKSSTDGEYTLTIGVPLISGEFGEIVDMQTETQVSN